MHPLWALILFWLVWSISAAGVALVGIGIATLRSHHLSWWGLLPSGNTRGLRHRPLLMVLASALLLLGGAFLAFVGVFLAYTLLGVP